MNGQTIGAELIGRKLRYQMGDFDAADTYLFTLDASDGLAVHHVMGASDEGDLKFSKAALDGARSFVVLSQGSALGSELDDLPPVIERDLPPFLLSRAVFAALKDRGEAQLKAEWATKETPPQTITLDGSEMMTVKIDGQKTTLTVLHAGGEDLELWVIDDARWPIILKREECGGDNFWKLVEAGKDLAPREADEDDEDDG